MFSVRAVQRYNLCHATTVKATLCVYTFKYLVAFHACLGELFHMH